MKKFLIYTLSLALALVTFVGCKKTDATVIKVNEVTDSIFYAPFYVAIEKGFFEEEGIKIELTNGAGSDVSMTALLSGGADIALLGPETTVYVARQNKKDAPKLFAQLTKRDGCFLISRNKEDNFNWNNLVGKEVIIGRQGGLPAMTFEYVVNQMGMTNGNNITLRKDIQFALMGPTFDNGVGDYVTLFEPTASEFVSAGKGHIVASVGEKSGEIPYTGFACLESYLDKNEETVEKFLRAMYKSLNYVKTAPTSEVADYLAKHFTTTSKTSCENALINYLNADTWVDNMAMTETAFTNLINVIKNAGENVDGVTYNDVVDGALANKIYNSLK
ncbi:MAG: ABC transporter substrate-binding protein [Clostridia bacterium]|nr:ABC transporter substrate-binding protein [Clostridia bacterium]